MMKAMVVVGNPDPANHPALEPPGLKDKVGHDVLSELIDTVERVLSG